MNTALLRVMYAPLDYLHPAYFSRPGVDLSAAVQLALNHSLIERFALTTQWEQTLPLNEITARLVSSWALIPEMAWLIGCKLARGSLALNGQLARLSPLARQFIALPVACPGIELTLPCTKENLTLHGAPVLLALPWPAALQQRLRLLFAPEFPDQITACKINRPLINFAMDYAQNPAR